MKIRAFLLLIILLSLFSNISIGYGQTLYLYQTDNKNLSINEIINYPNSTKLNSNVINLGLGEKNVWIKASDLNDYQLNSFIIDQSRLYNISIYYVRKQKIEKSINLSETDIIPNHNQTGNVNLFTIDSNYINSGTDIYFNLLSKEIFIVPIKFDKVSSNHEYLSMKDVNYGLYTGSILIMLIYHIFIFFSVRDKNYILYIFYIFFTWLTQISIMGYSSKYFWHNDRWLHENSVMIFSMVALIFGIFFTTSFLKVKEFLPKVAFIYKILLTISFAILILSIFSQKSIFFALMQGVTFISCLLAYYTALVIYFKKKYFPARFYLIAWSILILGVILFLLKDYEIVPYNNYTTYILQISTIVEIALLSFALADKINYFKKENEVAQAQALSASLENQKLIKEQNLILERKVKERTEELETANDTLNTTLNNLKDTQSQLVDAEKMAALGQLTAGIAHEINNPINFVTSNVKPLKLDIDDLKDIIKKYEQIDLEKDIKPQIAEIEAYKKQIDLSFINEEIVSLLSGISEGAKRTAEIIRSLRNFSRVDETDMKAIDLNEGLLSTLVLIRSTLPDNLTVIKDLGNLPKVECMPGKINQVFMNLVANAVQAIKSKEIQAEEEFLTIKSWYDNQQVFISIKDTGTGMTEEVKHRIFEPFFTTKDIGEGTGLGLSIVFSIIEKHKGHVEVISELGKGTEFIIILQVNTL